jgi:S-adenosyl-L-methionine hydrolase (adenosine-forming)
VTRPILFLSDYGLHDEYVGLCHAVIARLAPSVRVIDLHHEVPPQDVLAGALVLSSAVPHAPEDAVYLAVVDPGVGTDRRAVAVEAGRCFLVGPDNGLLWMGADALGGVGAVVELDSSRVAEGPISATFHGRDLFAPAAARLASGSSLHQLGQRVDPSTLVRLYPEEPEVSHRGLTTSVLGIDRFGNVQLAATPSDLARAGLGDTGMLRIEVGDWGIDVSRAATFADIAEGHLGLLVDSMGRLAIVQNRGSAAESLGAERHDRVRVSPASDGVG